MTEDEHIQHCVNTRTCYCGEPLVVGAQWVSRKGRSIYDAMCSDCYDGAPDSGNRNHFGTGATPEEAIAAWAERVDPWPQEARSE